MQISRGLRCGRMSALSPWQILQRCTQHKCLASAALPDLAYQQKRPRLRSAGQPASASQPHFSSSRACPLAHARRRQLARCQATAVADAAPSTTGAGPLPNIVELLRARGLVQDVAGADLEQTACQTSLSVYLGFDPTADSLHLGHLLGIVVLKWFQKCGHEPVALLGGATGRIGDPSGKSAERPVLAVEEIEANVAGIRGTLQQLLAASDQHASDLRPAIFLNNLAWFGGMGVLDFLRSVGKHARVNVMMSRESVKQRLARDAGISFTEFSYQLLQGYDFVHMARHHGVRVQLGGSDQLGNILTGLELARKLPAEDGAPLQPPFGLVFPLLTTSDGVKMGKSAGGAVWLAADKLSPFKFYQYLLGNVPDTDVIKFLKMLTFLPLDQIQAVEQGMSESDYRPNSAQQLLAQEVTRFVHGQPGLDEALRATQALAPGGSTKLDAAALEAILEEAPSVTKSQPEVVGTPLADLLASLGMQPSKSAARRLIKGGGVRINNEKVSDEACILAAEDLIEGRMLLLSTGKKNKMVVQVQ